MEFDEVFTLPKIESAETPAMMKRKRDKHVEAFEVLRVAANARVRSIEEDIYSEVEGRYELHRIRLGDIDVNRLLRAGTSGLSATASAPTSHKTPQ